MAAKKKTGRVSTVSSGGTSDSPSARNKIALTVKVDRKTYKRLVALRAAGERPRTHQEILREALEEYLDRNDSGQ